jgi:hypothetical protein
MPALTSRPERSSVVCTRSTELLAFLRKIDAEVPADLDVHLALDTPRHTRPQRKRWLTAFSRFVLRSTAAARHGSSSSSACFAEIP